MALFWSKKPKAEKNYEAEAGKPKAPRGPRSAKKPAPKPAKAAAAPSKAPAMPAGLFTDAAAAIVAPHVTEKSGLLSQSGVYTFRISSGATKHTVAAAVKALYKVSPVKVAIVNLPEKRVIVKGRKGIVSGSRKAMVTLKKGDKIEFI